jgi:hypothetical protein
MASLKDIMDYHLKTFVPIKMSSQEQEFHGNPVIDKIIKDAIIDQKQELEAEGKLIDDPDTSEENFEIRQKIVFMQELDPHIMNDETLSYQFKKAVKQEDVVSDHTMVDQSVTISIIEDSSHEKPPQGPTAPDKEMTQAPPVKEVK